MDNINKKAVGNRIKTIRTQKGLTMKEFGKLIEEAAQSLVTRWENGTSIPNNERLKKIADLGDMSVNELLYGDLTSYIHNLAYSYKEILDNTYFKESLSWGINDMFDLLVNDLVARVKKKNLSYEDKDAILQELYSLVTVYFGDFVNYNPEEFSDYYERFMGKHIDELHKTMQLYPEEKDQEKYSKWIEVMEKSIQEIIAINEK